MWNMGQNETSFYFCLKQVLKLSPISNFQEFFVCLLFLSSLVIGEPNSLFRICCKEINNTVRVLGPMTQVQ
jgi:hypothetical protein